MSVELKVGPRRLVVSEWRDRVSVWERLECGHDAIVGIVVRGKPRRHGRRTRYRLCGGCLHAESSTAAGEMAARIVEAAILRAELRALKANGS